MAGAITAFVRFGGCDYACIWCDSAHAVLPKHVREAERLTEKEIAERLYELPSRPQWVTLSGGNPALHDLSVLVPRLHALGFKIAVETQGTVAKLWLRDVDHLTISPKPPSSRNMTIILDVDRFFHTIGGGGNSVCLKVVVFDEDDLDYAEMVHRAYPGVPFYISIGTFMGGLLGDYAGGRIDTRDSILDRYRRISEYVVSRPALRDVRVLPQLHALIWPVTDRGH